MICRADSGVYGLQFTDGKDTVYISLWFVLQHLAVAILCALLSE
jgi:hypothetical protein